MRWKVFKKTAPTTHEGATAATNLTLDEQLRRSVLACLLWEDEFYEEGMAIADRIVSLASQVAPETLAALAVEARPEFKLRHAPLLLLTILARTGASKPDLVSATIERTIQRADQISELVAHYWRAGKRPLSAQMKKGLAKAFAKFDGYQLAKYDREGPVRLRDVLFLVDAKPKGAEQEALWRKLAAKELDQADTWEVALSAGAGKKETSSG
jgi:hypothetical protein